MKDTPQIQNADDLVVLYEELTFLLSQLNSDAPKIKKMYSTLEQTIAKQESTAVKSTQAIEAVTSATVAKMQKESKAILDAITQHLAKAELLSKRCEAALSQVETLAKSMQTSKDYQLSVEKRLTQLEAKLQKPETVSPKETNRNTRTAEKSSSETLYGYFRELGFEVIDRRTSGGALWVIGSHAQLNPYVAYVEKQFGITGKYGSSKTTDGRPAWWTKSKK